MLNRKASPPDDLLAYHAARQIGDDPDFTLSEIWESIRRRRMLILLLACAGLAAGFALALLIPPKYSYTSTIDIGVVLDDKGAVRLIEPPNAVLAKLTETYIPLATAQFIGNHPDITDVPALSARRSSNSDVIVVESVGRSQQEAAHKEVHEAVVKQLAADHRQRTFRDVQPERRLAALRGQAALLSSQLGRLETTQKFLEGEARQLQAGFAAALRNQTQSASDRPDGAGALATLAATQEVQQLRDRLSGVQERLLVTLPAERDRLSNQLEANQREQQIHQSMLTARDNNTLPGTRALSPPIRSLAPLGKSRLAMAGLGAGAGLVLGILVALLAGLSDSRRQPQASPRV